MDYAASALKQLEAIRTQTQKQLGELAGMLTPKKTAAVEIEGEKVTMNLVGKGESGIVMLVFKDKKEADKAFQKFIEQWQLQ